jgi:DNA-binding NarL/FixJ family response regulator
MENDITLTEREKTIIECLKQGKITDEEVADTLGISTSTVACFMQQLYAKFCLDNGQLRAKLVWEVMR